MTDQSPLKPRRPVGAFFFVWSGGQRAEVSNSTKKPKKKGSGVAISCLPYATVRTLWRISHKEGAFISLKQKEVEECFLRWL
jgi:hypothetical protein